MPCVHPRKPFESTHNIHVRAAMLLLRNQGHSDCECSLLPCNVGHYRPSTAPSASTQARLQQESNK